jgi:hypothetical protein
LLCWPVCVGLFTVCIDDKHLGLAVARHHGLPAFEMNDGLRLA